MRSLSNGGAQQKVDDEGDSLIANDDCGPDQIPPTRTPMGHAPPELAHTLPASSQSQDDQCSKGGSVREQPAVRERDRPPT